MCAVLVFQSCVMAAAGVAAPDWREKEGHGCWTARTVPAWSPGAARLCQPASPQPIREKWWALCMTTGLPASSSNRSRSQKWSLSAFSEVCEPSSPPLSGCQKLLTLTALRANFSSTVSENESLGEICHCLEKRPRVSCPDRLPPFLKGLYPAQGPGWNCFFLSPKWLEGCFVPPKTDKNFVPR